MAMDAQSSMRMFLRVVGRKMWLVSTSVLLSGTSVRASHSFPPNVEPISLRLQLRVCCILKIQKKPTNKQTYYIENPGLAK